MSYSLQETPKGAIEFARKRTEGLLSKYCLILRGLPDLLASAYLQGVTDAAQVMDKLPAEQPGEKRDE